MNWKVKNNTKVMDRKLKIQIKIMNSKILILKNQSSLNNNLL